MTSDGARIALSEWIGSAALPAALAAALRSKASVLDDLTVVRWSFRDAEPDLLVGALFDGDDRIAFRPFGGAGPALSFGRDGALLRARVRSDAAALSVRTDCRLQVPTALLKTVAGGPAEVLAVVEASVDWKDGQALSFDLRLPAGLDLPPSFIGNSGFVVTVRGLHLVLEGAALPEELLDAGFTEEFRGVYVARAEIGLPSWLTVTLPSSLVVEHAALGTEGFTGKVVGDYGAAPVGGAVFGLGVSLTQIVVDIAANRFAGSSLAGRVRLPLVPADIDFGASLNAAGDSLQVSVTYGQPLSIGTTGALLQATGLALSGTIGGGGIDLSGTVASLRASLGGIVDVDVSNASISLASDASGRTLAAAVGRATFGPLGAIDDCRLAIREDASSAVTGVLAGRLSWADFAGRIAVPQVITSGQFVDVALSWRTDAGSAPAVSLRVDASVDDLSGLFGFVPPAYRPEIDHAVVHAEVVYANAAALGNASAGAQLAAALAVSVSMRLPALAALPGVARVHTGNAAGLVAATLSASSDATGARHVSAAVTDPLTLELRLPGVPAAQSPLLVLTIDSVRFETGDGGGTGVFAIAGSTRVALQAYLASLASAFALPAELASLLDRITQSIPDEATFAVTVAFGGSADAVSIEVVAHPRNPPTFRLLEALGNIANPTHAPASNATAIPGMPAEFFEVSPDELRAAVTLSGSPSLSLRGSLRTAVLGESFDATIALDLSAGDFAITLAAGTTDPILICAPFPSAAALLGAANVDAIATTYGLSPVQRQDLAQAKQFFTGLATTLATQAIFSFEIANFGLRVTPSGPAVSGEVRLVQLPPALEALAPLSALVLGLGAELDKIYIEIRRTGGSAAEPLFAVPLPGGEHVDVFFSRFMLAYAWARNEFAFALDAGVVPSRTLNMTLGGSGIVLPAVKADVQVGATATAPPIPIPEGLVTFERPQRRPGDRAVDQLGMQAVVGAGRTRFVTAYLREVAFSPTYFLLSPGFRADGGLVLGGPDPAVVPDIDAYFDVRSWDRSAFFARFTVQRGTLLFVNPMVGVVLNPLAVVPPFVTANPPYWIAPPNLMGDIFADEIGVSANLPGLAFFDLTFERPLPNLSLQALLEFAALAMGGFAHAIPSNSVLREVFFTRLSVLLEVRLPGMSSSTGRVSLTAEANVVDLINGAIDLVHKTKATLDAAGDLIGAVSRDPTALVRMIPAQYRRVDHTLALFGFAFSGSVYLLTPEELHEELVLFFENKRRRSRGIGANRPAPAAPAGTPINVTPVLVDKIPVGRGIVSSWVAVRGSTRASRLVSPDMTAVTSPHVAKAVDLAGRSAARIDELRSDRERNVQDAARVVANALSRHAMPDARGRKATLAALGMPDLASGVEAVIAGLAPATRPPAAAAVAAALRPLVVQSLRASDDAIVVDSAEPDALAGQLVDRLVPKQAMAGRPATPADRPRVRPASDRLAEMQRMAAPPAARGGIDDVFGKLEKTLDAGAGDAAAQARAIGAARDEITNMLVRQAGGRQQKIDKLSAAPIDRDRLADAIGTNALATWRGRAPPAAARADVAIFDAEHFRGVLANLGSLGPRVGAPGNQVESVTTYAIQARAGGAFAIPVSSANAAYKVVKGGTQYVVSVRQADKTWKAFDLPAAIAGSVPEGPGKGALLRDKLFIAPLATRRPVTAAEADAVRERFDQADTLYMSSILARPEYRIKSTGGAHGPFYFADLLGKRSGADYIVPDGIALLGGFQASIFDDELRVAGMVVAHDGKPNVFLYGHSVIACEVGAVRVECRGDFVAAAGTLWTSVPLPTGTPAATDAISFTGHVVLKEAGKKVFEGSASGEFLRKRNGNLEATLNVAVASQGSQDFGAGDTQFARIAWSFAGSLEVELSAQRISVDAKATASVSADVATYETRWVVDIPAETICVPFYYVDSLVPPAGHWGSACATTPEVGHMEIDFDSVDWQQLARASCGLAVSVSNGGVSLSLDLGPLGSSVSTLIHTSALEVADLM